VHCVIYGQKFNDIEHGIDTNMIRYWYGVCWQYVFSDLAQPSFVDIPASSSISTAAMPADNGALYFDFFWLCNTHCLCASVYSESQTVMWKTVDRVATTIVCLYVCFSSFIRLRRVISFFPRCLILFYLFYSSPSSFVMRFRPCLVGGAMQI